ncbi:MAG: hypothetical protein ABSG43_18765, partial [Solirubrobacteraceae bacterium]
MRRLLIAALVVLCATTAATTAATATAATTAAAPTQADPSLAQLRGFVCQPAVSPAQREVFVQAVMRPLAGTVKMTMRFELLRRVKGQAAFSDVGGPDLGNWIS